MRMIGLAVAAAAAAALAVPAAAEPLSYRVTGRALAGICQSNQALCLGYVVGAVDALVAARVTWNVPINFCLPAAATNQQIADATVRALRLRPDLMDANGAAVVAVALNAAYPCTQPPQPAPPRR